MEVLVSEYACAILARDGLLMLGRRSAHRRAYAGCWDVIGGKVEPGETVPMALVRELGEELGIVPTGFRPVASLRDDDARGPGNAIYHFFLVTEWQGGMPAIRDDEHSELGWFSIEEACALEALALAEYRSLFRSLAIA